MIIINPKYSEYHPEGKNTIPWEVTENYVVKNGIFWAKNVILW
jgi:hypothetical protein